MRLLLDTQVFLWWLADSRRLGKAARERIEAADEVYVSAASIVECEAKIAAGLLEGDVEEVARGIRASGFLELPVRVRAAAAAGSLKKMPEADFIDRLLVAQAMAEPLKLLTANAALKSYSELVEVAGASTS
ncbi:MAG TPA: type II toxin-antitoxin system VapC family toxin [Steroidobacteraceae bacterium]|nr:type II toxin-antitoxin system VapC family toxin [Steroidobacteraceae bacterium]